MKREQRHARRRFLIAGLATFVGGIIGWVASQLFVRQRDPMRNRAKTGHSTTMYPGRFYPLGKSDQAPRTPHVNVTRRYDISGVIQAYADVHECPVGTGPTSYGGGIDYTFTDIDPGADGDVIIAPLGHADTGANKNGTGNLLMVSYLALPTVDSAQFGIIAGGHLLEQLKPITMKRLPTRKDYVELFKQLEDAHASDDEALLIETLVAFSRYVATSVYGVSK